MQAVPTFVVDTHVFYWYFRLPQHLSMAADAIFRLASAGNARIIVPAIVVAELYFLSVKLRQPFPPARLFELMDEVAGEVAGIELSDLGRTQLERLDFLDDIPEIHDRLIAAEATLLDAPIITRDQVLARSAHVRTIW